MKFLLCLLIATSVWDKLESDSCHVREQAFQTLMQQAKQRETSVQIILTCLDKNVNDRPQTISYKRILYLTALDTIIKSNRADDIPLLTEKEVHDIILLPEPHRSRHIAFYALQPENNKLFIQLISNHLDSMEGIDLQLEHTLSMLKPGVLIERWEDHKLHTISMFNFGELTVSHDTEAKTLIEEDEDGFIVKESECLPLGKHKYERAFPHRDEFPGIIFFAHKTNNLLERWHLLHKINLEDKKDRLRKLTQATWRVWRNQKHLKHWQLLLLNQLDHQENSKHLGQFLYEDDIYVESEYEFMGSIPKSHHQTIVLYLLDHGSTAALDGLYHWSKREPGDVRWALIAMLAILQREYDHHWIEVLKKEKRPLTNYHPEAVTAETATATDMKHRGLRIYPQYRDLFINQISDKGVELFCKAE